jgi:hypothetical protein
MILDRTRLTPLVASLAPIVGLASSPIQAQFVFEPSVEYGQMMSPAGMTSGDFDGDGDIDLATTADGPERVAILPNTGDGTFGPIVSSPLPQSSSPRDLIAGDFDGDLDIDLAVALRDDPNGTIRILFNNGTGSFTMGPGIPVGDRPGGLSAADMDGDGDLDLAVANRDSDTVSVLANDGTGIFVVTTVAVGPEPRNTAFGNLLGGTALEIAVTNHDDRTVSILQESGGNFVEVMTLLVGDAIRPDGIVAADLTGDGLVDFAVATSHFASPQDTANWATVFINTGTGFDGPFNYDTGGTASTELIATDFDCDGMLDLAISNTDSNDLSLMRNNGDGTFAEGQRLQTGAGPSKVTAADLDGMGGPDIAVANSVPGDVSVLLNRTCAATSCPWDLGGDGMVGIIDLLDLLAQWGANPGGPPDFNGDGVVGISDFIDLLANWGPCP